MKASVRIYANIFLLSTAILSWEIGLSRIFAITQFYHFAFLAINVALLGFGAGGAILSLRFGWVRGVDNWSQLLRHLQRLALMAAFTLLLSYLLINHLPFDSYAIAWDRRQLWLLLIYYFALILPFLAAGLAIGLALSAAPALTNRNYAANLTGSALGALLPPLLLPLLGLERMILVTIGVALLAAGVARAGRTQDSANTDRAARWSTWRGWASSLLHLLLFLGLLFLFLRPSLLTLRLSPYKGLSQALHYPDSRIIARQDSAVSRIDLIASRGVRSLPGLSLAYRGPIPPQLGAFSDGDDLSPILQADRIDDWRFLDYLPEAIAYRLAPSGPALVLHPRGGLAIWQALNPSRAQSSHPQVVAVETDPILVAQINRILDDASPYRQPAVREIIESPRSFLARDPGRYAVLHLALSQTFRPITSGAFSLSETYDLTQQAFDAYLDHLAPDGLLVMTRWLQTPPSESLRALALLVQALRDRDVVDPAAHIVALRGVQTVTFLVRPRAWASDELATIRSFARDRKFDIALAPDLQANEINRYNILPQPYYENAYQALLAADPPNVFYRDYPFAIDPPTDDHPFFFHFFKWVQTPVILRTLGQTWQPFGGSGILVLVALLILAALASLLFILAPVAWGRLRDRGADSTASNLSLGRVLLYFAALGFGFLLVEIPLIQQSILFLGHPTLALAVVLAAVLLWSGLGSLLSPRVPWSLALIVLLIVIALEALLLPTLFTRLLPTASPVRLLLIFLLLAPLGLFMGMPFPLGLVWLRSLAPQLIPWAWAINGGASVVASILAALMALQWGFSLVLWTGFAFYLLALFIAFTTPRGQTCVSSKEPRTIWDNLE